MWPLGHDPLKSLDTTMKKLAVFAALFLLMLSGCRAKRAQPAPTPPLPQNVIGLLPEEDGSVGGIVVTNTGGAVTLSEANTITLISAIDVSPTQPVAVDSAEIAQRFGAALDGLPEAQLEFVLYFELGGDQLTSESEALLPGLLQAVQDRQSTDVSIIGHTDTTGSPQLNYELALRRAESVATILRQRGLDPSFISVESHGQSNLLVPTADGVAEPRNRRVEVTVR